MLSLKNFHLVFILLAIVGADLFGAWAVWHYATQGDAVVLALGILAVLGGFGLILYAFKLVREMERVRIE
jgi:hypothetical protein